MEIPNVPLRIITNREKVLKLYKKALRNIMATFLHAAGGRARVRYESVLLRQRFEENRDCCGDEVNELLIEGEKEFIAKKSYSQIEFAGSLGGLLHERDIPYPDFLLDYWHPLEKAQYPEYFARREKRKKEYVEMWNKLYTRPPSDITPPKPKCV